MYVNKSLRIDSKQKARKENTTEKASASRCTEREIDVDECA